MREGKFIWLWAALLLAGLACSRLEPEQGGGTEDLSARTKILFTVAGLEETKTVTPVTSLSSFYATAVTGEAGSQSLAWGNAVYTRPGGTGTYSADEIYWPTAGDPSYKFYASSSRLTFQSAGCTLTWVQDAEEDIVCAYNDSPTYKSASTELSFQHIQARLSTVKVTADTGVEISNVTIWMVSPKTGGTYNLRTGAWNALKPNTDTERIIYTYTDPITAGSWHEGADNDLYLVPGDYYLKATWTARLGASTHTYTGVISSTPVTMTRGKRNAIEVTLSGTAQELSFTVSIAPWGSNSIDKGTQNPRSYALPGAFSVSATQKVYFSVGNHRTLMGTGTPYSWLFPPTQNGMIGNAPGNTSLASGTYVDLFGWTGNSAGTDNYGLSTSTTDADYGNTASEALKTEWGNVELLKRRVGEGWRTLTAEEWTYLLSERGSASSKYGQATVVDVPGLVLLPDEWVLPGGCSFTAGAGAYSQNSYDAAGWSLMENAGAVFLPAGGYRSGTTVTGATTIGYYWSSTSDPSDATKAHGMSFSASGVPSVSAQDRSNGYAVRLVRE